MAFAPSNNVHLQLYQRHKNMMISVIKKHVSIDYKNFNLHKLLSSTIQFEGAFSNVFPVRNGVKEGGVLSLVQRVFRKCIAEIEIVQCMMSYESRVRLNFM